MQLISERWALALSAPLVMGGLLLAPLSPGWAVRGCAALMVIGPSMALAWPRTRPRLACLAIGAVAALVAPLLWVS